MMTYLQGVVLRSTSLSPLLNDVVKDIVETQPTPELPDIAPEGEFWEDHRAGGDTVVERFHETLDFVP